MPRCPPGPAATRISTGTGLALLPHYPRATFVVLDVAGHNLQIEQPTLFDALIMEWLDRVAAES